MVLLNNIIEILKVRILAEFEGNDRSFEIANPFARLNRI